MKPTHPQAEIARHEAKMAREIMPHSGLILHLATELRNTADELDRQYHKANIFIPKPRWFGRRRKDHLTSA